MPDTFTDLGFDLESGVIIFRALNISETDLKDPMKWQKIKEIGQFTSEFQDGASLLQHILTKKINPDISPLDFVHNYTQLRTEMIENNLRGEELRKKASQYE